MLKSLFEEALEKRFKGFPAVLENSTAARAWEPKTSKSKTDYKEKVKLPNKYPNPLFPWLWLLKRQEVNLIVPCQEGKKQVSKNLINSSTKIRVEIR